MLLAGLPSPRWRCPEARSSLLALLLQLPFLLQVARLAEAFDIDGHDAQGQTAASAMDQTAISQVKRLLGGQDASDVAGWGHQVDDTYPDVARLHLQIHDDSGDQPFCGDVEKRIAKCEDNICLLSAVKHFYGKILSDEGRKMDYPFIDYSKVAKGIRFTDADSVKMLINLIGDMHQPLHLGYASDNTGLSTVVKFKGSQMSLYDLWDKGISETVRNKEQSFWLGGWTHVRAVQREFEEDSRLWKEEGAFKSFDRWAKESVKFACEIAYKHPLTGKMLAGPNAEVGQMPEIDDRAYMVWREKWLHQVLLSGARTAIVLNDILDARGAAKLAQGSGVKTNADEEKRKQEEEWEKERQKAKKQERQARSFTRFNFGVLMTNLSIAAVVVPAFLLIVNYGMKPENYAALVKSIMEGGNSSNGSSAPSRSTKRFE